MRARAVAWLALLLASGTPGLAGWRLAAYLGGAASHNSRLAIEQPPRASSLELRGVSWQGRSFEPPLYYGYRLGYFFGPFGLEAEFIHQKIYARPDRVVEARGTLHGQPIEGRLPFNAVIEQFSISHGLNMLLANVAWERRLTERTLLQLRFGAGPTIPHPESSIRGESRQGYELGRPAIQGAAALEFRLWRGLHALGEYKFTRTRQGVSVVAGRAETLVRSHHGVFGIGLRF